MKRPKRTNSLWHTDYVDGHGFFSLIWVGEEWYRGESARYLLFVLSLKYINNVPFFVFSFQKFGN